MTLQEIKTLVAYNAWATNRIFEAVETLPRRGGNAGHEEQPQEHTRDTHAPGRRREDLALADGGNSRQSDDEARRRTDDRGCQIDVGTDRLCHGEISRRR